MMALTREPSGKRVDHGARFVDAPTHARDDLVDDLHQVRIVGEAHLGAFQLAPALHVHLGVAVDENVRNGRIGQQRLERPEAEHLMLDVADQARALGVVDQTAFGQQSLHELGDLFSQPLLGQALHHCQVHAIQQLLMDGDLQP